MPIDVLVKSTFFRYYLGSVFSALAFDSRSHLLYYVDNGLNVTGLIAVNGGHHKLLASYSNGYSPQGLAIDPVAKYECIKLDH
jgi:hypothetical protein